MVSRHTVLRLGFAQLVSWGISYYLIGTLGPFMTAELGWSQTRIYGGFSLALVVMGCTSPLVGRLIDRYGGRRVMAYGSWLVALACVGLACAHTYYLYYGAWLCLGIAMRMTLYDAAFATLAQIGGPAARRSMAHITLLGGLASTVFWPFGELLAQDFGWRPTILVYAAIAVANGFSYVTLDDAGSKQLDGDRTSVNFVPALARNRRERRMAGGLYALIAVLIAFLNSAMAAHLTGILVALGLASAAVWVASLRGIGQSLARLTDVLFGSRLSPLTLNLLAVALLALGFAVGLASTRALAFAIVFSLLIGAGNGLMSITRGTVPLVLFDHRMFAIVTGKLLAPSFIIAAPAPMIYAWIIERFGGVGAVYVSVVLALLTLAAAGLLSYRFGDRGAVSAPGPE